MTWKELALNVENNSPAILAGLAVLGVGSTAVLAYKNTLHAMRILDDEHYDHPDCDLTPKEEFQLTWKCYIPTAISALSTMGCIIGSYYCSNKQAEALSSAYLLSQTTLHEYQRKVVDRIGENKERELRNEVIRELADKQQTPSLLYSDGGMAGEVIDTGKGNTLFYDVPGQLYFKSDINFIKAQVNDLNYEVRSEMVFDWNEIYYRWGLPHRKYGSEMIFDADHPLEIHLEPEMMDNGQVRILIDYELWPKSMHDRRY